MGTHPRRLATRRTPWLALVVIAEGEATLSGDVPIEQCVTPGRRARPGPSDVATGTYLSVTQTVVNKVFPTKDDVPLLCHVREVDVNDTELANGDDDGFLAVVIANRLPQYDRTTRQAPVRYLACLINLEGQLDVLPPPQPPTRPAVRRDGKRLRRTARSTRAAGRTPTASSWAAASAAQVALVRAAPRARRPPSATRGASPPSRRRAAQDDDQARGRRRPAKRRARGADVAGGRGRPRRARRDARRLPRRSLEHRHARTDLPLPGARRTGRSR